MCGIAGFIGTAPPDRTAVEDTLAMMRQRGPDGLGFFEDRVGEQSLLLLHSRLAIIDPGSRSNQPFIADGVVLAFNGEIYNYVEVRQTLIAAGHRFRTDSDTEVIVRAYLEWGAGLVDRLEGMWAFAIFDSRTGDLLLSRDPFGEKPLYTMKTPDGLYFGSEIKFIKELSGRPLQIDHAKVHRFLAHGYRDVFKQKTSFFDGVTPFPAASTAILRDGNSLTPRVYWTPRFAPQEMSADAAIEGVRERLFEAIKIRLRADVPIALTLSGGVDSNVISGIAVKKFGQSLHTFSMLETREEYDERAFIKLAVESLGTPHRERPVSDRGFLERLGRMAHHYEAPVLSVGMFLEGFLTESVAAEGFKLAINGNGSDEIFAGYYDHYLYWLAGLHGTDMFEGEVERWRGSMGRYVRNPLFKDPYRFVNTPGERGHLLRNAPDIEHFMRRTVDLDFDEQTFSDDVLRGRMLNELMFESVPATLFCGDLNWMYHSIENRTAFLDRPLIEFMLTVPSRHLIQDGYSKYLLRKAAESYVPDEILFARQKFGFNAPITSLLNRSDPDVREFMLMDSPVFDLVKRDAVERMMDPDGDLTGLDNFLFCVASAKMFYATQHAW